MKERRRGFRFLSCPVIFLFFLVFCVVLATQALTNHYDVIFQFSHLCALGPDQKLANLGKGVFTLTEDEP